MNHRFRCGIVILQTAVWDYFPHAAEWPPTQPSRRKRSLASILSPSLFLLASPPAPPPGVAREGRRGSQSGAPPAAASAAAAPTSITSSMGWGFAPLESAAAAETGRSSLTSRAREGRLPRRSGRLAHPLPSPRGRRSPVVAATSCCTRPAGCGSPLAGPRGCSRLAIIGGVARHIHTSNGWRRVVSYPSLRTGHTSIPDSACWSACRETLRVFLPAASVRDCFRMSCRRVHRPTRRLGDAGGRRGGRLWRGRWWLPDRGGGSTHKAIGLCSTRGLQGGRRPGSAARFVRTRTATARCGTRAA